MKNLLLGALIGDMAGSVYEWNPIKTKAFPLFAPGCSFTDDTVMTLAVAEGVMQGGREEDFIAAMKRLGRMFPNAGYGGRFARWLAGKDCAPYHSFGNGSAMRVSPCAWAADPIFYTQNGCLAPRDREQIVRSAAVTHNHEEGIKGALAIAEAIVFCRAFLQDKKVDSADRLTALQSGLKARIQTVYGYDLSKTPEEIRPDYSFDVTCQGSVPQAIASFLAGDSFEDVIRNAVSLGGDSDTLAAMAGSIAEAVFPIPEALEKQALARLPLPLLQIVEQFARQIRPSEN